MQTRFTYQAMFIYIVTIYLSEVHEVDEEKEETCPVCAEKGFTEPRKVQIEETADRITKRYSPCGHKHVMMSVEDRILATNEVHVRKNRCCSQ